MYDISSLRVKQYKCTRPQCVNSISKQQHCAGIFAESQQCRSAVFHRNINSFVGMQQTFHFTFSAVIDYSVDIFCFVQPPFVSSQCGLEEQAYRTSWTLPSPGGNKGSGQGCLLQRLPSGVRVFVCLEEWLGSGVRVVFNSRNVQCGQRYSKMEYEQWALTVCGGDQAV